MGNILGRYILREVVLAWLLVTGVLLVILLAYQVVGVLERAAVNQFPPGVVLQLICLGALQYLSILLPVGLLLGVVLAFGRLYADSEMAAALACGAGPANIYLPVALLAVVVAVGLAWLTLVLAPEATAAGPQPAPGRRARRAVRAHRRRQVPQLRRRQRGGVRTGCEPRRHAAQRVRGAQPRAAGAGGARRARPSLGDRGRHDTHSYTLRRGALRGRAGQCRVPHRALRRARRAGAGAAHERDVVRDLEARPSAELARAAEPAERAELQWRIATPLMCLVLALIAVPLARLRPRQGRYARVWIALIIFLLYTQLISVGKVWIARGTLPGFLGLWWTHAAVVLLALLVILGPRFANRLRYRVRGL